MKRGVNSIIMTNPFKLLFHRHEQIIQQLVQIESYFSNDMVATAEQLSLIRQDLEQNGKAILRMQQDLKRNYEEICRIQKEIMQNGEKNRHLQQDIIEQTSTETRRIESEIIKKTIAIEEQFALIRQGLSQSDEQIQRIERDARSAMSKSELKLLREIKKGQSLVFSGTFAKVSAKASKPVVLYLNDTFDSYHHGSTATSLAVMDNLIMRNVAIERIHMLDLYAMDELDNNTVENFISKEQFLKWSQANPELCNKILVCDEVVVNGEGCVSYFNANTVKLIYLIYVIATRFNKKVSLINTSVLSENYFNNSCTEKFEKLLQLALKETEKCAVRENYSMQLMQKILPGKAILAFDSLPLYIKNIYRPVPIRQEKTYCIVAGGNFLPPWYAEFVMKVFPMVRTQYKIEELIVLSSEVNIPTYPQDVEIFEQLSAKLTDIQTKLIVVKTVDEWLTFIGRASFLISGRFHHSIASYMLDTSFAAFQTNNIKLLGALELMKCEERLLVSSSLTDAVEDFLAKCSNGVFDVEQSAENKNYILELALKNFS